MTVGAGLTVGGAAAITGRLTAGDARVSGAVAAATLSVAGDARVGSLTAAGAVRGAFGADRRRRGGRIGARRPPVGRPRRGANGGARPAPPAVAGAVRARSVLATGTLSAASGVFANLTVGSCTGC